MLSGKNTEGLQAAGQAVPVNPLFYFSKAGKGLSEMENNKANNCTGASGNPEPVSGGSGNTLKKNMGLAAAMAAVRLIR